ncbi:hypothetical protein ACSBR2_024386 [Camellia fascicularis]
MDDTGEGYNLKVICKNEKHSRAPFPCIKRHCDRYCGKGQDKGWGKCKDDDQYVCQCFHICNKDISSPLLRVQKEG